MIHFLESVSLCLSSFQEAGGFSIALGRNLQYLEFERKGFDLTCGGGRFGVSIQRHGGEELGP